VTVFRNLMLERKRSDSFALRTGMFGRREKGSYAKALSLVR